MANGFQGPPAVDFYSMLSGLGDSIQSGIKARQQKQVLEARKSAFSDFTALDPGSPDYGKQALTVAQKLGSVGDQEGALKFLTLAQSATDKAQATARDNRDFGFRQTEAQRAQSNADRAFNKDKFTIKEQTNPDTGETSFVRINTEGPEGAINTSGAAGTQSGEPRNPYALGGKTTAEQDKSAGFADRMMKAEAALSGEKPVAGQEGPTAPGVQQVGVGYGLAAKNRLPAIMGNSLKSSDEQKYDNAKLDFIAAQLRKESGAAINQGEYDNAYKQYFPQPGDGPAVLQQKASLRRTAIAGMARDAGRTYRPGYTISADGTMEPRAPAQKSAAPKAAAVAAPAGAIAALKKDPRLAAQFEAKYGPGSAKAALGGGADE
jgi:hypothetical protein